MINTFDWLLHVRDLQKWYIPSISEDEMLKRKMSEIMLNLLQMKMEAKANNARSKWEKRQAEILSKQKSKK